MPLLWLFLFFFSFAYAETSSGEGGGDPNAGPPKASPPVIYPPMAVPWVAPQPPTIFDDSVFKLGQPPANVPKTIKGASGTTRYTGEDPDYNSVQREDWMRVCEPKKKISMEAFRECYREEKNRNTFRVRERFDATEKKQKQPFQNTRPRNSLLE